MRPLDDEDKNITKLDGGIERHEFSGNEEDSTRNIIIEEYLPKLKEPGF